MRKNYEKKEVTEDKETKEILENLDEKIKNADNGKDAKDYAEARRIIKDAEDEERRERRRLKNDLKKSRWMFGGTIGAALITITGKILGDIWYQSRCQQFEDQGAYCNYQKHRRR